MLRGHAGPGAAEAWHRPGRAAQGQAPGDPRAPSLDYGHSARWRAGTAGRQLCMYVQEPPPERGAANEGPAVPFSVIQRDRKSVV